MEPINYPAPQENVLDVTDMHACEECRIGLIGRFHKMVNSGTVDVPFKPEDFSEVREKEKNEAPNLKIKVCSETCFQAMKDDDDSFN